MMGAKRGREGGVRVQAPGHGCPGAWTWMRGRTTSSSDQRATAMLDAPPSVPKALIRSKGPSAFVGGRKVGFTCRNDTSSNIASTRPPYGGCKEPVETLTQTAALCCVDFYVVTGVVKKNRAATLTPSRADLCSAHGSSGTPRAHTIEVLQPNSGSSSPDRVRVEGSKCRSPRNVSRCSAFRVGPTRHYSARRSRLVAQSAIRRALAVVEAGWGRRHPDCRQPHRSSALKPNLGHCRSSSATSKRLSIHDPLANQSWSWALSFCSEPRNL
jgi:hypothetical protein